MSIITLEVLQAALPGCSNPAEWVSVLSAALEKYEINSYARMI